MACRKCGRQRPVPVKLLSYNGDVGQSLSTVRFNAAVAIKINEIPVRFIPREMVRLENEVLVFIVTKTNDVNTFEVIDEDERSIFTAMLQQGLGELL